MIVRIKTKIYFADYIELDSDDSPVLIPTQFSGRYSVHGKLIYFEEGEEVFTRTYAKLTIFPQDLDNVSKALDSLNFDEKMDKLLNE